LSEVLNCIDAGSENCPCFLAVTGDCLTCSRLQGKDFCDCHWRGVCIYNEFIQGNCNVNNPRKDFEADIVKTKFYKDDLVVFVLNVGKGFALKASIPGTYLFIKGRGSNHFYDVPISVMRSDIEKGQVHLAIKIISSKTKALLLEKEKFVVRGPYRNGIQGISQIIRNKAPNQRVLIVAKGIGIAPGILTSKFLNHKRIVDITIDTEKISKDLISDYLESDSTHPSDGNIEEGIVRYVSLSEQSSMEVIESLMQKNRYDSVIILTSDYYTESIVKLAKRTLPEADLAISNNFHLCCGEGLCGSCSFDLAGGNTIKMCKCQLTGDEVFRYNPTT